MTSKLDLDSVGTLLCAQMEFVDSQALAGSLLLMHSVTLGTLFSFSMPRFLPWDDGDLSYSGCDNYCSLVNVHLCFGDDRC